MFSPTLKAASVVNDALQVCKHLVLSAESRIINQLLSHAFVYTQYTIRVSKIQQNQFAGDFQYTFF